MRMRVSLLASVLCFLSLLSLASALSYSGMLKGKAKLIAPSFSGRGHQCSAGTGAPAEYDFFSFVVDTAPTAFFVRALFDEDTNDGAIVRISSAAPTSDNLCTGTVRGAASQTTAPNVQFVHWAHTNGTYYVTVHLTSALDSDENGLFAISVDEAAASANTAELATMWFPPTISGSTCNQGLASPYAHAQWTPSAAGLFDVNVILEHPEVESMKSTLSIWACTTPADLPGNGFSTSTTFDTCTANNTNTCTNVFIRQSSLGFAYHNMQVNYGASAIAPRLLAAAGTTYYIMFGADSGTTANSTGFVALAIEPTRFEPLQTTHLFNSPDPSESNCTINIEHQANAYFYYAKSAATDVVVLIDSGATDFDSIGSFYQGENAARTSCGATWFTTVDLDSKPLGITITESYQGASVIVSPYSGTGSEGWLVQVWAMSGPAITHAPSAAPSDSPAAPAGSPTSPSAPVLAPSTASSYAACLTTVALCVGFVLVA